MMRFTKRFALLLIIFLFSISNVMNVYSYTVKNTPKAQKLKELGLLSGTANGFELGKSFTRAQGAVMILRLAGLENAALSEKVNAVFTDVPKGHWAAKYVNYAYKSNIVKGTSAKTYSPDSLMTGKQFITLVLRMLGYQEAKPETALPLAVQSGLLSLKRAEELTEETNFLRDDMVEVAYDAICTKVKDSPKTLLQKLVEDKKLISKQIALQSGLYAESSAMDKIEDAVTEKLK